VDDHVRDVTTVELTEDRLDGVDAVPLVQALVTELDERYGGEESDPTAVEHFLPPDGAFFVAWLDGVAVGCGALRRHDATTAEIKRMFVSRTARRAGVGRTILDALEDRARARGYAAIVLETGTRQPEAIAMYEQRGYTRIPNYGFYADSPLSVCMRRELSSG
jgi:GNAT superfamily N-acetyltransferase